MSRQNVVLCDVCGWNMTGEVHGAFYSDMIELRGKKLEVTIEVGGQGANDICLPCGKKAASTVMQLFGFTDNAGEA